MSLLAVTPTALSAPDRRTSDAPTIGGLGGTLGLGGSNFASADFSGFNRGEIGNLSSSVSLRSPAVTAPYSSSVMSEATKARWADPAAREDILVDGASSKNVKFVQGREAAVTEGQRLGALGYVITKIAPAKIRLVDRPEASMRGWAEVGASALRVDRTEYILAALFVGGEGRDRGVEGPSRRRQTTPFYRSA
jgi:hypothetical protein